MKRHLAATLAAVLTVSASPARAQTHVTTVVTPTHISAGSQLYSNDLDGLRDHLETYRLSQPSVYNQLDSRLARLESANTTGNVVMWGSVGLGLTVLFLPLLGVGQEDCSELEGDILDFNDTREEDCRDANLSRGLTMMAVGGAIGLGGGLIGYLLKPTRDDRMDYINEHNRVAPSAPLKLNVGYSTRSRMARATLRWMF